MRVTSQLWAAALIRRANAAGAFATVVKKGASEAGALHVVVNRLDQTHTLFSPAPQISYTPGAPEERLFYSALAGVGESEIAERLASEARFDPDVWIIEIEDRDGRCFIDSVVEI